MVSHSLIIAFKEEPPETDEALKEILDEPAASLDPIGRQDVLKIMSKLSEYTTIFYSTHILD
ncbi:MAG: hypothetical protein ACFFC7_32220, partial [Candidatus Hermodarchaeota archaeon]